MHEVDELTNIVTDVVGDPTLPRYNYWVLFRTVLAMIWIRWIRKILVLNRINNKLFALITLI